MAFFLLVSLLFILSDCGSSVIRCIIMRSSHDVCKINAYEGDNVYRFASTFQLVNPWTDLAEIWYSLISFSL
jgi:hypothetical protein